MVAQAETAIPICILILKKVLESKSRAQVVCESTKEEHTLIIVWSVLANTFLL
jgi:hypothetical protein